MINNLLVALFVIFIVLFTGGIIMFMVLLIIYYLKLNSNLAKRRVERFEEFESANNINGLKDDEHEGEQINSNLAEEDVKEFEEPGDDENKINSLKDDEHEGEQLNINDDKINEVNENENKEESKDGEASEQINFENVFKQENAMLVQSTSAAAAPGISHINN
uniref:Uncharacterized protein n=1 Tax=Meloidogyne hapla TaxID=6305 RepID=A0A1I8BWM1_MELHA